LLTRGPGHVGWYTAVALAAAAAFIPVSESSQPTGRLRRVHRWSAMLIVMFATVHVFNHTFAIVSVAAHTAVLETLRVVYRAPVLEAILFCVVALQIGTCATLLWRAHLRRPSVTRNVQALSGVYLAVFFIVHITAALIARPETDTNFVWAAGTGGLLASPRLTFLLPYYLLGVAAFLTHLGAYLRIRYAGVMPAVSVQRLSYAGMAFSGAVVVTVGLALCGIRLMP
jgi:succinate dehydrogenase/fumarate reductase cytochrome b subunit